MEVFPEELQLTEVSDDGTTRFHLLVEQVNELDSNVVHEGADFQDLVLTTTDPDNEVGTNVLVSIPERQDTAEVEEKSVLYNLKKCVERNFEDISIDTLLNVEGESILRFRNKKPDDFLQYSNAVRIVCTMNNNKVRAKLITFNRQVLQEVDEIEDVIGDFYPLIRELRTDFVRYVPCLGLSENIAKETRLRLEDILIEKFLGRIIYRSRSCKYVNRILSSVEKPANLCSECFRLFNSNLDNTENLLQSDDPAEPKVSTEIEPKKEKRSRGRPRSLESGSQVQSELDRELEGYEPASEYVCKRCGKTFPMLHNLKVHLASHLNIKPHTCNICGKGFRQSQHIRKHKMGVHSLSDQEMHSCHICNKKVFETEKKLAEHISIAHNMASEAKDDSNPEPVIFITGEKLVDSLQCSICDLEFKSSVILFSHKDNDHGIKHQKTKFHCGICLSSFSRLKLVEDHQDEIHFGKSTLTSVTEDVDNFEYITTEDGSVSCSICFKVFSNIHNLKEHFRIHSGLKPFTCNICQRSFTTRSNLNTHCRSEHRLEKTGAYACKTCVIYFSNVKALEEHARKHSLVFEEGVLAIKCSECEKIFSSKSGLKSHMASHSDVKEYICHICGASFARHQSLRFHRENVHDQVLVPCDECGKTMKRSSLASHRALHKEKKHLCTSCGERFYRIADLKLHQRKVHTGETPFTCDLCPKAFTSKAGLRAHKFTHGAEKKFTCDTCFKGFYSKNKLTMHLRMHTGEKPFQCPHCNASFSRADNLKAHLKKHGNYLPDMRARENRLAPEDFKNLQLPNDGTDYILQLM